MSTQSKSKSLIATGVAAALSMPMASALALEESISLGMWANYTYDVDSDASEDRLGDVGLPALILYVNHEHNEWFFNAETRFGEGSFQSFSGDDDRYWGFKELAVGRHIGETMTLTVGKTEVPFTYSRFNFWPGERLIRGFGDQYNVGARLDVDPQGPLDMSFMFIKSQNWGSDTTSMDDGAGVGDPGLFRAGAVGQHWGSNDTYQKVNTVVGDFGFTAGGFRTGLSLQAGQLVNQDPLVDPVTGEVLTGVGEESETHFAAGLYTEGTVASLDLGAQFVAYDQGDVDAFMQEGYDFTTQGSGQAMMLSAGLNDLGNWYPYADLTWRSPDSDINDVLDDFGVGVNFDDTFDLVLGTTYNYGPGWIYAEVLLENLTDEENGLTGNPTADGMEFTQTFSLTMDYYF
ncbi:hypothetical protein CKO15_00670 [Halorhodospira abdelmalekii]|uniref:hypothetical protein n=1 Tax=Halorhodospira abdelmalekii TaxID=421629 RepID=UPI00190680FF|nr:hypothetical protein [Halorhodospira abdelmalekii]MBK1733815.1 hypothetical protein [Halorhodospira abdelmalekii]